MDGWQGKFSSITFCYVRSCKGLTLHINKNNFPVLRHCNKW